MAALPRLVVCATAAALSLHAGPAAAQAPAQSADDDPAADIGGFAGVRVFSPRSTLGAVTSDGASIASSLVLGMRLSIPVSALVSIEGELPLVPTTAREEDAALLVIEPRVLARLGGGMIGAVEPFASVGLGLPMVISSDRDVIEHDVVAALHAGLGARIARRTGWDLRIEARAAMLPGRGIDLAAFDFEVTLGLYRSWGKAAPARSEPMRLADDADGDGVADADDRCPDRDEDLDGIEDQDGCPDIDDDRDEILDTFDQCRLAAETRNGFRDDDGCPDRLPEELAELIASSDALLFSGGSARLRSPARRALTRLADLLDRHDSVRLLIMGHTDDREGAGDATRLSQQRAEAVRDFLVGRGVALQRLEVWGGGAAHPRAGNDSSRGRTQNRRVTLQILRPDLPLRSQLPAAPEPAPAPDAPEAPPPPAPPSP
jgi:OOP family OmpA-OmpF porin